MSESSQSTCYLLSEPSSLCDVINFHCQRHNLPVAPLLVWLNGQRVSDLSTPLPMSPFCVLRCEVDWQQVLLTMQHTAEAELKQISAQINAVRKDRIHKQEQQQTGKQTLLTLQQECSLLTPLHVADQQVFQQVLNVYTQTDNSRHLTQQKRKEAEERRKRMESASVSALERRESSRLSDLLSSTSAKCVEVQKESVELNNKKKRVMEELAEHVAKHKDLEVRIFRLLREKEGWKKKVSEWETLLNTRLSSLESEREECLRTKMNMESSELQIQEKRSMRDELHRTIVGRIEILDRELSKQTMKLKSLEADHAECIKAKHLAKLYEQEAKECVRYKQLVKSGRVREKSLEKDIKELVHWRQRSKAFERESKQLRRWKREVQQREHIEEQQHTDNEQLINAYDYPNSTSGLYTAYGLYAGQIHPQQPSDADALAADAEDDNTLPLVDYLRQAPSPLISAPSNRSSIPVNSNLQPTAAPFIPRSTNAGPLNGAYTEFHSDSTLGSNTLHPSLAESDSIDPLSAAAVVIV